MLTIILALYVINDAALGYMKDRQLPQVAIGKFADHKERIFLHSEDWERHLQALGLTDLKVTPDPVLIASEGALWGAIRHQGLLPDTVVVSDDAGQFRIGVHALCWVHAERLVHKLLNSRTNRGTRTSPKSPGESDALRLELIGKHVLVIAVPVALEYVVEIVSPFEAQKLGHLRPRQNRTRSAGPARHRGQRQTPWQRDSRRREGWRRCTSLLHERARTLPRAQNAAQRGKSESILSSPYRALISRARHSASSCKLRYVASFVRVGAAACQKTKRPVPFRATGKEHTSTARKRSRIPSV